MNEMLAVLSTKHLYIIKKSLIRYTQHDNLSADDFKSLVTVLAVVNDFIELSEERE